MPSPRFKPGKSGNPSGRPANKAATILLRKAISEAMPEIIQSLIDAALSGDTQAATTLLNRCVPALKAEAQTINLPVKPTLVEQGTAIVKATMGGSIPPDVGAALITALANQSRIIEIDDLTKRMEILEASR
jgi:Family of unknown function (DUF5681)